MQNCTVAYNLATTTNVLPAGNFFVGGGAYCYNGGTIQNCTIVSNAVTSENCPSGTTYYCSGGGVHSWHAGLIQNCRISGNRAVAKNLASGGGVYLHEGSILRNCVVYSNTAVAAGSTYASGAGGGVYIDLGGDVECCTIVRNLALGTYSSEGSGIFTFRITNNIRNTIVYFNAGENIYNDGTNGQYTYVCSTPRPDGTGNTNGNPALIDLNSGNCHLQAGSICIDAGITNDAPILDLDCMSRPLDGNGDGIAITDIGAYEYTTNPLSAPTGVYASPGLYRSKNRVVWNAVSGASIYEVWRGTSDNAIGSTRIANTVTDTGYDDTAVMQSRTYYYWVKAKTSTFSSSDIGFVNNHVASDFDGDGYADPGVFLASRGEWIVWLSSAGYSRCGPFSNLCYSVQDIPVPADFDGDGSTDPAVYQRDSGDWYVWFSGAGYTRGGPFNLYVSTADVPIPEDFDGDGKADPAVFVSESGNWYVWFSGAGYARGGPFNLYVTAIDAPAPADFDGDGKADPAVFVTITGDWYVWFSGAGYTRNGPYNLYVGSDDTPIAADFDNDGKADPAIYQNTEQSWYIWFSGAGYARGGPFHL
ncbi:MAG: VCBS repeat-containing protein [Kiritimatiellia bacterium]|nr:VCBS repeat-containing protein [Kiritimatiellia bacterium]